MGRVGGIHAYLSEPKCLVGPYCRGIVGFDIEHDGRVVLVPESSGQVIESEQRQQPSQTPAVRGGVDTEDIYLTHGSAAGVSVHFRPVEA